MKSDVEKISDHDFYFKITFEKNDYSVELKDQIRHIRNNFNMNGFRKNNTPIEIIYQEYGFDVLSRIINRILSEEFKKIEENYKKDGQILFPPILVESSLPNDNKAKFKLTNVDSLSFKFIYGFTKEINFEYLKNIISDIEIDDLYCSDIDDDVLLNLFKDFIISIYFFKGKTKSGDKDVLFLKNEDGIELILPSVGFKIGDSYIDLMNKTLGEEVELDINTDSKLCFDDKIFDVLNHNFEFKGNKKNFKIFAIHEKLNYSLNELVGNFFEKLNAFCAKNIDKSIYEYVDITLSDFNSKLPVQYGNILDFERLRNIFLYSCNYILKEITNLKIKDEVLSKFKIDAPEYINENIKKIAKNVNDEVKATLKPYIENKLILDNIEKVITDEFKLNCTKEDIDIFIGIISILRNNETDALLSNFYTKNIKNKFMNNKNTYESIVMDRKVIFEIKNLVKIKKKEINYKEFLDLFK